MNYTFWFFYLPRIKKLKWSSPSFFFEIGYFLGRIWNQRPKIQHKGRYMKLISRKTLKPDHPTGSRCTYRAGRVRDSWAARPVPRPRTTTGTGHVDNYHRHKWLPIIQRRYFRCVCSVPRLCQCCNKQEKSVLISQDPDYSNRPGYCIPKNQQSLRKSVL